ncbi:MAG TPA: tRNA (adenosine(37)-N6)-threonylcarbamoyltransferase complex ATPase subunit type 1 TsaE [Actinomycetota bacterium]|nr:tRNA (adenosine(37)-N6)-threonylcarbamoyltransferase complex ATPase subunit type 1 TsaE [Actinomycetota bacterium]
MSGRLELATSAPEETRRVGAALAGLLVPGDVVSLSGELGAGKTCLVQGAAAALGVTDPVASPTFVLVREYRGSLPVYHLDVYRLERLQEVIDLGYEDLLDPRGVMFVEWGDAIEALLPESHLDLRIEGTDDESRRRMLIRGYGRGWAERWERLEDALSPWGVAA